MAESKKYHVTTSHWNGDKRKSEHFEVTAEDVDLGVASDTSDSPVLIFTRPSDDGDQFIAGFERWDAFWEDGAVTPVQPMVKEIVGTLELTTDDYTPRARPTRSDRG
jgi:hypothetical protein